MFSFVALSSSLRFYDFSLFQTIYAEEKDNVTELNTLNNIGIIKGKKNNHLEAILDFDKAIKLNHAIGKLFFERKCKNCLTNNLEKTCIEEKKHLILIRNTYKNFKKIV